ncbi:S8 family serine peptidase [Virgibacillus natechei]|nr:S8 family serine peptidase [Virgibacillus natechei]
MTFSLITPGLAHAESNKKLHESLNDPRQQAKVSDRLVESFSDDEDEKVTFLIKFSETTDTASIAEEARVNADQANLSAQEAKHTQRSAVVSELKTTALTAQADVKAYLEQEVENGNADNINSYHIVNGMAVTATKEVAEKVSGFAEVEKVLPNEIRELHETTVTEEEAPQSEVADIEWNVEQIGAPAAWDMGADGSGTVVASIDTGAEWDHPALKENYRGYDAATGEVDHEFNWFDAPEGEEEPYDPNGHGTHVTGTMVGAEPDGSNQVGVAPGAEWIAVNAFDSGGNATDADLLAAAEWILAPTDSDGNTNVDMAPDVVNNSWGGGPGLDEWYRDVVQNWRAAEIFPEFSAGNTTLTNPGGPGSVAVPANYPESFATGATDSNDELADFSLRGPSPYDEVKPDISAPGVNIRSSVPGGGYEGGWNGTSMSGPAVSAVVALLKGVDSSLTVDEIEEIIESTATTLTDDEYPDAPNNGYGHGLANAHDAVASIVDGLGTLQGQVTKDGEDTEAPTFGHEAPTETYAGMDLDLSIQASDNISVTLVELNYQDTNGEWQSVEASLTSGNYTDGEYVATIPGEDIDGDSLTYYWVVDDFGNNEVTSDEYVVSVEQGITVGYSEDFETEPTGWTVFGEMNSWEWGEPTSGPGEASTGEHVYATNLNGNYDNDANTTLMMPPVDLPEGDSYLQFDQWFDIESGWDYGHVFISTDQEDWTPLMEMTGESDGWESAEVDLSEYSDQRVYIGFNLTSDVTINEEGLYIDDVALSDSTESDGASVGLERNNDLEVEDKEKADLNERVDPNKILPVEEEPIAEQAINPAALPVGAQVNVVETDRSTNTDPADGTYSLLHAAGEFTVQAEAYGFHSAEQTVTIEDDETTQANFTLEEVDQNTVSGTITDEATDEPIEGATIILMEDANVTPVETDADGSYSLTAYEDTYTLRVLASGYHTEEVEVNLDEDSTVDVALEPFYTIPGGEIGYDDGNADNARAFFDAGNGWSVKMSLSEGQDTAVVTDGVFQFHDEEFPDPGGTAFEVEVWDATGADGTPGEKIAGPVEAEAIRDLDEWTVVDLSDHSITVDGDFYMVYIQTQPNTGAPGLATDETSPNAERSYQYVGGEWSQSPADEGNYMIRSRVSYEAEEPVITSPAEDFITNESEYTVEGTASPTTTAQVFNNEEEVGSAEVGDDGEFAIPTALTEGENEITVVSFLDGTSVGESEPVIATLDTEAPELTIDTPQDGDRTNSETVTVEGTVSDDHLDTVEVNGQEAEVTDGSYSERIMVDNGENEIEVVASDLAGNTETQNVTIDVNYTAPEIENVNPTEDQYIQAGETVTIEFESEPGLDATFSILMPLTNGQISNATELPMQETSDGHYVGYYTATSNVQAENAVIEVSVVDGYGNQATEQAEGTVTINEEDDNGNGNGNGNGLPGFGDGHPGNGNGPPFGDDHPGNGNGPPSFGSGHPGQGNGPGNN